MTSINANSAVRPAAPTDANAAEMPAVSVVIPTWNRPAFLREALAALVSGEHQDFEVLVMDQTEGLDAERVVAEFDKRFVYHRMARRGANPARNLGAALAQASLVAFLDDDCVPRSDWLARIVSAFNSHDALEFIFGQLKAPPHGGTDGWFPETLPPADIHLPRYRRKIAVMGAGANMSCRKSLLRRVGAFDELRGSDDLSVINADTSMAYKAYRHAIWMASSQIEVVHVNGFRPWRELSALFRSYSFELGLNYGRFARRRDFSAAWIFLLEQYEMLAPALAAVVRLRRPRGLGAAFAHARGFLIGILIAPEVGFIDGDAFRRMETTRRLDLA